MSYGPLKNCYRCKTPLDLNDPANGGYCGGDYCLAYGKSDLMKRDEQKAAIAAGPNRQERRIAAAKARRNKFK